MPQILRKTRQPQRSATRANRAVFIDVVGDSRPVRFAAAELSRYLRKATGSPTRVARGGDAAFRVGVCGDLGMAPPRGLREGDDWISVKPDRTTRGYVITGSNPRSVVFAVYAYLRACGFRWIRPGKRGEIVPKLRRAVVPGIRIDHRPSYRYRTICIEGACSEQHVRDLIDWMAKHGMNGYFIQFHLGTIFFKRWYEHRGSNAMKPETFGQADLEGAVTRIVDDLQDRGMRFERMGHGWTCAALGISGEAGWDKSDTATVPPEKINWLAEVNGKKELWGGVALNTNLNYGNPAVRSAMTDAIVDYCRKHPQVDLVHFWLADGSNNHDERPESSNGRPSDYYVDMLNELDEKLSAANIATRIVFLIYVDLLWAPTRARIKNPQRFTLMFAPITRSYLRSFVDPDPTGEHPTDFVRNKLQMPKSVAVNLKCLRDWQSQFHGDGFDFDYHMIWACYYDLAHFTLARTLHRDIQGLEKIGLHGLNSCQATRMSYPTNLLMDVMARTLWDKRISFERIVRESFRDAFGERDGAAVARVLQRLSKLWEPMFEPLYMPKRDEPRVVAAGRNLRKINHLAHELDALVRRNASRHDGAVAWSWRYLKHFVELLRRLLPAFEAYVHAAAPDTREKLKSAIDFIWRTEPATHPALDAFELVNVLTWRANEVDEHLKTQAAKL